MHHRRTGSSAKPRLDVIVVGAGLAGLTAAKICHDKGLNIIVLEGNDRVGGHTLSDEAGCDLGGSYFVKKHNNLFNLVAELGLKLQPQVEPNPSHSTLYYSNGKKRSYKKPPFINKFHLFDRLDFIATKNRIDSMCATINLQEPWNSPQARNWDSITFKDFLERTCKTISVKEFMLNLFTPANLNVEAEECSLLSALTHIRSWGGVDTCIGMENGSEMLLKIVGGSQQVSKRLSQQIGEERILMKKVVHTIEQDSLKDYVTVLTRDGIRFEARRVIVALSSSLQANIHFKTSLPLSRPLIIRRTHPGLCSKIVLHYDEAYWFKYGLNGNLFVIDNAEKAFKIVKNSSNSSINSKEQQQTSNSHDSSSSKCCTTNDICPITFATTDSSCGQPSVIAYACASSWVRLNSYMSQQERIACLTRSLGKIICPEMQSPTSFKEYSWVSREFSQGAYTSTTPPGALTRYGNGLLRNPINEQIYFASSELSASYKCTMEGAIRSGKRTAYSVLESLSRSDSMPDLKILKLDDDEETSIPAPEAFIDKHADKLLCLANYAPVLLVFGGVLVLGLAKVSCRLKLSI